MKCVISYFATQPHSPFFYLAMVKPSIEWTLMGRTSGGLWLVWEDRSSSTFISETTQFTGPTNRPGSFTKQQWEKHKDRWLISLPLFKSAFRNKELFQHNRFEHALVSTWINSLLIKHLCVAETLLWQTYFGPRSGLDLEKYILDE